MTGGPTDVRATARHELAAQCAAELGRALPVEVPTALAAATALRGRLPGAFLVGWVVLMAARSIGAHLAARRDRRLLKDPAGVDRWLASVTLRGVIFGLCWGALPVASAVHADQRGVEIGLLLANGVCAVLLAAAPFRRSYAGTTAAILAPAAVAALVTDGLAVLGLLAIVFWFLMVGIQGRMADARLESAMASHTVRSLVAELDREHARVRQVNEQLSEANQRLHHNANHDVLTGLPNRALLFEELAGAAALAAPGAVVGVCYCDLDGFKPVNDTHGHEAGDELLRAVGGRLRAAVGARDLVARLGGDEFVVLVTGLRSAGDLEPIARRLRDAVRAPVLLDAGVVAVDVSIGVAATDRPCPGSELLARADAALYRVKRDGRGGVAVAGGGPAPEGPVARAG